jgi:hypothetical protein
MEPIINPAWFYFIELFNSLRIFFLFGGGAVIIFLMIIIWAASLADEDIPEKGKKFMIRSIIISSIIFILGLFIPSKTTCYRMMTASLVTPNNIEVVGNSATDMVDYIVDSVDKILNKEAD